MNIVLWFCYSFVSPYFNLISASFWHAVNSYCSAGKWEDIALSSLWENKAVSLICWWWNIANGLSQCAICSWDFKERSNFSYRDTLCPYLRGRGQFLVTQAHLKNVNVNTIKLSLYGGGKESYLYVLWSQILCVCPGAFVETCNEWLTTNYSPE